MLANVVKDLTVQTGNREAAAYVMLTETHDLKAGLVVNDR